MIADWPCPLPDGGVADELAVHIGDGTNGRILVIPPLFDEHNKMRRHLIEVMRRLGEADFACFLPDLPGWNESSSPLEKQTLGHWQTCIISAVQHFEISHVLAVRSGALLLPETASGWTYAPQAGSKLLRSMLRARTIASKEAGKNETLDELAALGRSQGIVLAGWRLSASLFQQLENAEPVKAENVTAIDQSLVGRSGLWLRAEPDEDPAQADALATAILEDLGKPE
ncbi:hypothetical protein [Erythrobacter crassostreae]|uniref:Uncharacterized protein n=1 Tax=Erythrobacter crassostreae TaxID=2828328 RepID=A0A9X1JQ32_9SPHN|nr:hypothetical protein [Erythrobacter crassostrea]MBV7260032.1 hypothetical protein [Erythrobacter crassostrea]